MSGHTHFSNYFQWLVPATLGNVVGGVAIVSVLNFGQVRMGTGDD
jgi:formate/nitrite transporter FocA (FNT family)